MFAQARRRGVLAGGASRPRQPMEKRAQRSRGQSGTDARDKEDRGGAVHRRGTSSDELGHGRARKKTVTTASHLADGSHTRAQLKGLDEAELLARGIGE